MKELVKAVAVLWKTSRLFFVCTFLLSVCSAVPGICSMIVWKRVLDHIAVYIMSGEADWINVLPYLLADFALKIITDITARLSSYIQIIYSRKVEKYVTNETLDAIGWMELKEIEDADMHNVIQKASDESSERMMGLLSNLVDLVNNFTTFAGMSGILLLFNVKIYILIFISILPMAFYSTKYFNRLYDVYNGRVEKIRFSRELKSMVSRSEVFKEIKIFHNLAYIKKKLNEMMDEMIQQDRAAQGELNKKGVAFRSLEITFICFLKGAVILVGIASKQSVGTINMNMDSVAQMQNAISGIAFVLISMHQDGLYLSAFSELMKQKHDREARFRNRKQELARDLQIHTIELAGVWFRYTQAGPYILKDLNVTFETGKAYAVVGCNGGGKSTLVKLLMGLYTPTKGSVLVNGKDLTSYDINVYREKLCVVFQDFVKYPLTVRENIAMGNTARMDDDEKIQSAAENACAAAFISGLAHQYDEKLVRGWEGSTDLSIGQWQRIAIARSMMREGQVAVFDEPSAALDAKTESRILSDVMDAKEGRIGIIITHRFLNIRKADSIIVLRGGEIECCGRHQELLENSTTYRELYDAQKEMI